MSNCNRNNFREIHDLLEKLCKSFTKSKHKEILRNVTKYISNCPTAFGSSSLPFDESSLVSKITKHLTNNCKPANDIILFNSLHEQLKACQTDQRQRSALLTFLYFMAESKINEIPINNGTLDEISKLTSTISGIKNSMKKANNDVTNPVANGEKTQNFLRYKASSTSLHKTSSSESNFKIAQIRSLQEQPSDSDISVTDNHFKKSYGVATNLNDDLVQNVIYSFTGIQGKYLKKDVINGEFKLESKAGRSLNIVQAGMLLKLSKLGYYHDQVQSYTDVKKGKCALGLTGQGFISALKNELTKYYGMVAMLQEQLNSQRRAETESWKDQNNFLSDRITLMKIMVWAIDPLHRLQWLAKIAEACQNKKGGVLASTVYEFLSNGDPTVRTLVRDLLLSICGPLHHQLSRWLLEGEIIDPHNEFFIEALDVGPDRLWHEKYRVRAAMLPIFISTDLANKILITGKSINFLYEICDDKAPIKGREELRQNLEVNADNIFSNVADTKLHAVIDTVYLNTSKKVLDIVLGPHKLLNHLQGMKRYLLLGQGDFIGILMANFKSELDKPAKNLHGYELQAILDAAIRSSNSVDDSEISNHLDVKLMNSYDGDTGWENLLLLYVVRGPLKTMLEPSMHNYKLLFKKLWKMKHIEFLLSSKIWKDQMSNAKQLRLISSKINPILYRLHLYTSEMIHFIHQMEYYILFEVIECSWAEFQEKIHLAKALDDILLAHDEFLKKAKSGAFLDEKSNNLDDQMSTIYVNIDRLDIWQDKFFENCFKEFSSVKAFQNHAVDSELKGEFGVTTEMKLERDQQEKLFEQYLAGCEKSLEKIGNDYELAVRQFLLMLNSDNDHNLQLFGMRLDFNEYYKKRDERLDIPLTFEHMMRNSNAFICMSSTNGSNVGNNSMNYSQYSIN